MLGFEEEPPVDQGMIREETIRALFDFVPSFDQTLDDWLAGCTLRPDAEVDALEDLFYCAHDAVRSAQLGGDTVPPGFHPIADGGVLHERGHASTWALSPGVAWDDTSAPETRARATGRGPLGASGGASSWRSFLG